MRLWTPICNKHFDSPSYKQTSIILKLLQPGIGSWTKDHCNVNMVFCLFCHHSFVPMVRIPVLVYTSSLNQMFCGLFWGGTPNNSALPICICISLEHITCWIWITCSYRVKSLVSTKCFLPLLSKSLKHSLVRHAHCWAQRGLLKITGVVVLVVLSRELQTCSFLTAACCEKWIKLSLPAEQPEGWIICSLPTESVLVMYIQRKGD